MIAHPFVRRMTDEIMAEVVDLSKSGIVPSQILTRLRISNPSILITAKDVHNVKREYRIQDLGGELPITVLFSTLEAGGYVYESTVDDDGVLDSLFLFTAIILFLHVTFKTICDGRYL